MQQPPDLRLTHSTASQRNPTTGPRWLWQRPRPTATLPPSPPPALPPEVHLSTTPLSPVYEVVAERLNSQLSRVHLIDTKISALIAAVIAMMVVFLNKANEWYLWMPPLLFLWPLIELSRAFTIGEYQYHDPPGPEPFAKHYGNYPEATQIAVIRMIIVATRTNAEITRAKGQRFDRGLTSSISILLAVFVADIILQVPVVALRLPHTVPTVQSVQTVGTPAPQPRPRTVPTVQSVGTPAMSRQPSRAPTSSSSSHQIQGAQHGAQP